MPGLPPSSAELSRADTASAGTRIPVQLKRVARRRFVGQLSQHLPAVVTVLTAGASAVVVQRVDGALPLAVAELLVGAVVLAVIAREAWHTFGRHTEHGDEAVPHEPPRIDAPGLAAAALGYVEVWHRAHERGHFALVTPQMLGATATLFLAVGGRRLIAARFRDRRPHFSVTALGASYRASRRVRWTAAWTDVAAVEHGDGVVTLHMRDGSARTLRAEDHFGGAGLVAAARTAFAAHAPAHLTSAPLPVSQS